MPQVRARAHLGDVAARDALTQDIAVLATEVSALSDEEGYGPLRYSGIECFLPVDHRREVRQLTEIVYRNQPAHLSVGRDGAVLRLGYIEVHESLRRQGLGTAALMDLCRFADRDGRAITGFFDPAAGAEEWLAEWYESNGFRPLGGGWERGNEMLRPPSRQNRS